MTYEHIYDLKFNKKIPTYKISRRFPGESRKIMRVALLQLPFSVLKKLVKREELKKLKTLKQTLSKVKAAA